MAFSEEYALLIESAIRETRQVIEENRLLREEISRNNVENRDLLASMQRRIEMLGEVAQNGQRRRQNRASAIKVPRLCSVSTPWAISETVS